MKITSLATLATLLFCEASASEVLDLDVIAYEALMRDDSEALDRLQQALHEKGIVGVKGIPDYKEKLLNLIEKAREFSALSEEVKEAYAPNRALGDLFLGYERGKEKFQRPDGKWVVDDLKVSYYGVVPGNSQNRWPVEVDLGTAFEEMGMVMSQVGRAVMQKIGLTAAKTGVSVEGVPCTGRLLHYSKSTEGVGDNPLWCGAHFDHSVFTALLPAFYFSDGQAVDEPVEAGLFIKTNHDGVFRKVLANDPDVLMFQAGEFGQLATDDAIRATEHRVHKASGVVERYTMALFFEADLDTVIHSHSELTQDARYGGGKGDPCTYRSWKEGSFNRYIVKEEEAHD